jgi:nucleoid-associated protein YgaU
VGICDIVKANGIKDPNLILAGDMLTIPVLQGAKDDNSCLK